MPLQSLRQLIEIYSKHYKVRKSEAIKMIKADLKTHS
jgi:hypothetical protein